VVAFGLIVAMAAFAWRAAGPAANIARLLDLADKGAEAGGGPYTLECHIYAEEADEGGDGGRTWSCNDANLPLKFHVRNVQIFKLSTDQPADFDEELTDCRLAISLEPRLDEHSADETDKEIDVAEGNEDACDENEEDPESPPLPLPLQVSTSSDKGFMPILRF